MKTVLKIKEKLLSAVSLKKRLPISQWIQKYSLSLFLQDLLAGLSVGMTEIPQGIAYAIVAGLAPEYGLYSGLLDGFIYAFLGGCKDLNIGLLSLMLQPHVATFGPDGSALLTFLSGIIILVLGVLQLGFVIDFFSDPIIAGFICGSSVQIASSQIKNIFGISGTTDSFIASWRSIFQNIPQARLWDTVLGLSSVLVLIFLKEIRIFGSLQTKPFWSTKRNLLGFFIFMMSLARNALVVIVATAIAYYLNEFSPFKITGKVSGAFPPIQLPKFGASYNGTEYTFEMVMEGYGASLIFVPLISILEAISIAKAFSKGKKLDATQEMLALGICNTIGSLIGSMLVTGSFTKSAVNNASGVRTTFAGVFTSALLLLSIAVLTPSFHYVPKSSLAAIIICAMLYLFDWNAFSTIWRTKKLDFIPFLTTFLCCLLTGVEYGILIGLCVNLLFVLYASARPTLDIMSDVSSQQDNIITITPKDTLYFPAAEFLRDTVLQYDKNIILVINGKYIRNMDLTVAKIFDALHEEMIVRKQKIVLVNFKKSVFEICVGLNANLKQLFNSEDELKVLLTSERS